MCGLGLRYYKAGLLAIGPGWKRGRQLKSLLGESPGGRAIKDITVFCKCRTARNTFFDKVSKIYESTANLYVL